MGIASSVAGDDCWNQLPDDARRALRISFAGPFPNGACKSLVSGDFNGDNLIDYALLVGAVTGAGDSAVVLVLKDQQWTLSAVRRWFGAATPTAMQLLPPGQYVRAGSILEELEPNEVPVLVAKRVGVDPAVCAAYEKRTLPGVGNRVG